MKSGNLGREHGAGRAGAIAGGSISGGAGAIRKWAPGQFEVMAEMWRTGKTAREIAEAFRMSSKFLPKSEEAIKAMITRHKIKRNEGVAAPRRGKRRPKLHFVSKGPGSRGGKAGKRSKAASRSKEKSFAMRWAGHQSALISLAGPAWSIPEGARSIRGLENAGRG